MATPKGKVSKARRNSRRANWKLSVPGMAKCPKCGKLKLAHRVCPACGYYSKELQAVEQKAEATK